MHGRRGYALPAAGRNSCMWFPPDPMSTQVKSVTACLCQLMTGAHTREGHSRPAAGVAMAALCSSSHSLQWRLRRGDWVGRADCLPQAQDRGGEWADGAWRGRGASPFCLTGQETGIGCRRASAIERRKVVLRREAHSLVITGLGSDEWCFYGGEHNFITLARAAGVRLDVDRLPALPGSRNATPSAEKFERPLLPSAVVVLWSLQVLARSGADLLAVETIPSLLEAQVRRQDDIGGRWNEAGGCQ